MEWRKITPDITEHDSGRYRIQKSMQPGGGWQMKKKLDDGTWEDVRIERCATEQEAIEAANAAIPHLN
jgi:hypothetical protein